MCRFVVTFSERNGEEEKIKFCRLPGTVPKLRMAHPYTMTFFAPTTWVKFFSGKKGDRNEWHC